MINRNEQISMQTGKGFIALHFMLLGAIFKDMNENFKSKNAVNNRKTSMIWVFSQYVSVFGNV